MLSPVNRPWLLQPVVRDARLRTATRRRIAGLGCSQVAGTYCAFSEGVNTEMRFSAQGMYLWRLMGLEFAAFRRPAAGGPLNAQIIRHMFTSLGSDRAGRFCGIRK